ncbi:hypothetical protein CYMTET_4873 [Cymbomonas tetramitiformis]|uniref:Beta-lactamase-related domain-containing protein n=1 Tax=Cymbomonas tetramitiformis TaxID=36881 RepID=A0AAE0LK28_9CHLO|nr:hypothetical protein CYMTET_4873 [Cymbomonas tetramitiformis]
MPVQEIVPGPDRRDPRASGYVSLNEGQETWYTWLRKRTGRSGSDPSYPPSVTRKLKKLYAVIATLSLLLLVTWIAFIVVLTQAHFGTTNPDDGDTTEVPIPGLYTEMQCPRPVHATLPQPYPPSLTDIIEELDTALEALFNNFSAQSMTVAIQYDQRAKELASYGYGDVSKSQGSQVGLSTVYRIGTMSTVLTELLFGNLLSHVNQTNGLKLHPEHLVSDYFPEFAPGVPPDSRRRHPTVQDLALHTSGLPRYSPCRWGTPDCNITAQEACRRMANWTLLFEPGASVSYSNAGFSLLGAVMEEATNKTYQDLMKQYISKPLELEHTAVHPPIDTRYQASAYDANGNITGLESFGFDAPSAELWSNGNDLIQVLRSIFRGDVTTQTLPWGRAKASAKQEPYPQLETKSEVLKNPTAIPKNHTRYTAWGAPWEILTTQNPTLENYQMYDLVSKTGTTDGYNSLMIFDPDLKLGMVALMAEDGEPSSATSMPEALINLFALTILPKLYRFLEEIQTTQQQNHKELPYDPTIYIGKYAPSSSISGISIEVHFNQTSNMMYVSGLQATPSSQDEHALQWLHNSTFQLLPLASSPCFVNQADGPPYNLRFDVLGNDTGNAAGIIYVEGAGYDEHGLTLYRI